MGIGRSRIGERQAVSDRLSPHGGGQPRNRPRHRGCVRNGGDEAVADRCRAVGQRESDGVAAIVRIAVGVGDRSAIGARRGNQHACFTRTIAPGNGEGELAGWQWSVVGRGRQ